MANVKFLTGTETNLLKKNSDGSYVNPIVEGSLYVTAEKVSGVWVSNLYYDINGQRIKVADTSGKAMYDHMNNNIAQTYIKKITMEGTKYASTDGATLTYTTGNNVETTILLPLASTTKAGTVNTGAQTFAGNKTFMGQVILQGGTDTAAGTANSGALIIGSPTGAHISVDANEIQAKSSGTASAQLHINNDGGITQFGGIVQPKVDNTLTLGTEKLRWKTIEAVTINATTFNGALNGNVKGNLDGNASTADKWYTARTITLGEDMQGTVSIDGSKNVTLNAVNYSTSCSSGNKANYPWHRIATTGAVTGSHNDKEMIIAIRHSYDGGGYGVAKIALRTNNVSTGGTASASIIWLYRYNIAKDALKIGLRNTSGNALADLYYKVGTYARCRIYQLQGSRSWTLIASNEVDNTTTTDKLTSKEVYTSVSNGNTILAAGYTSTVEAADGATVQNANYATTADGAKTDSANNTITTHYLSKIGFDGTTNKTTKVVVNLYNGNGAIKATVDFPTASASQAGAITTGTQTLTGAKTLDANGSLTIQKNSGFNYSGIGTTSDAVARHVWFSHSSNKGMPILSDKFKYNPASTDKWATVVANATDKTGAAYGKLIVDVLEGIAARAYADDRGQQISKKYVASLSFNGTTNKATKVTMTYNDGTGAEIKTVDFPTASASSAGAITTGTQTLTGAKTLDANGSFTIQKTSGFNYSGIETASSDSARHVWFSHASNVGTPVKNDKFKLNPGATDTWATVVANATDKTGSAYSKLIVDVVEGMAARAYADDRGQKISTKYVAAMAFSGTGSTVTLTYRDGAGADIGTTNIPVASTSAAGIITNAAQSIGGDKTFHGMIKFPNVTTGETKGIQWTMADNDSAKIIAGSTASDSGYLEIQTNDNGNEPIYVRQYSAGTLKRTLTLLNASGNTVVPGNILPVTHASADTTGQTIGSSSALWKEIYARIFYAYSKFTTPSGLFYANNDGDMYVANNTGLGVAPDSNYALKVTGNTFNNGIVYFGNGTTNYVNNSADARFNTVGINGANTTYRLYVNGNTLNNGIVYFANGTTYYINNSADTRLRYVGVGSLAPSSSYALRIGGNVYLNGIHYFANGTTYYVNNSGVAHFKQLLVNGGNTAYDFSVSGTGYFASNLTIDGDVITKGNFKNPNGVVSFVQNNTIVTATTDWNTLTTPGCYKVQVSAWGDAATYHSPNSAQSSLYSYGLLFVIKGSTSDSENRTLQIYFPHQTSTAHPNYCRMLNGTGWQAWHKFHRGALDLTGGTMTGTINAQHIYPKTDNTYNNGSSTMRWKEIHGYTIYAHTKFQNPAGSFYADSNGRMYVQNGTGLGVAPSTDGTYILKVTGNSLFNGILYFANATTYYINNSGTANLNGLTTNNTTHFKKGIRIGDSATGDTNYICFYGTTGDGPGSFNHTYIGENQWDTTIEASELLLFKGNDMASGTSMTTAVAPGPDRIRMVAAGHLFQTYETAVSGTWTAVCDSTVPKTRFEIFRDGTRTHGTAYFASGSTYYINNSGHTFLPIVSVGGAANIGYNLYVQGTTLHNGIVYFANAQNYYINNSADTRLRYTVIGGTSLSPSSTYPLQVVGNGYITGTLGIAGTNTNYKLYVNGTSRFNNTLYFFNSTGDTALSIESRRSKNSSNENIETNTGLVTKNKSFIEIRGFAPPTMIRTTGDRPAPYGLGFGNGSESAGIMPIGEADKLQELMFYGANSGPTLFTWKYQLWEDASYDTDKSNGYSAAMMSLNSKTGDLYVKNTIGINGQNTAYKLYVGGTSYFTGIAKFVQGSEATSKTTGAVQITGGIAVSANSYFANTIIMPAGIQMLRWTTSTTNNNSTGRSWYGIGTYANTSDSSNSWLNISNYWGINITTRGNTYLRHNNNIIPHTANTSGTVGSGIKPVYINGGVITASSSTVGSGIQPIYLNAGTFTVSAATIGDANTPIYLVGGTITRCTTSLTDYIRKDGSNYFVQLTGGDGNTTGYRLIGQITLGTWSNYRQTWIISGRHCGNGILTLAFGNNTSSTASISTSYCQINYHGNTSSGSIVAEDSFVAYMNGSTIYFFWKYWDYTQCNITILGGNSKGFTPTNGTWMASIDTATYGTRMSTTRINPSNFATKLETPRTFTIGNTSKNFDGTSNVSWTIAEIGAVNKAGDTMTGALNFANNVWNKVGDDASFGDNNTAGSFAIKGLNGNTNLKMVTYNNTTYGTITWNGSQFVFSHTINGNISGNSGSATRLAYQGNHTEAASGTTANAPTTGLLYTNGLFLTGTYNDSNTPCSYGNIINVAGGGTGQLLLEWRGSDSSTGGIFYRSHRDTSTGGWGSWRRVWLQGDSVTSAVWNDYAECRKSDSQEPGYVMFEKGDDSLSKTIERLQHFAGIVSDTWGFSQGETADAKTNIAVAGRVLAYPYRDRNEYKPGDCVCAAPGGKVDIMTREEVIEYPDRIVGTVSCVPEYETWGGGELADRDPVKVNGRIWIKVK